MIKKILFVLLATILVGSSANTADVYVATIHINEADTPTCNENAYVSVSHSTSQLIFF